MLELLNPKNLNILFLGETYRADAQTWIRGIEQVSGVKIQTSEIPQTSGRFARMWAAFGYLLKLIFSQEKYDITLAERATSYGFFSLMVKSKVRVVAQQGITDAFPTTGFSGSYKRMLQRAVYTRVDLIHAWGSVMTYAMLESGAPPERILVCPKGLDLTRFRYPDLTHKKRHSAIVTRSLFPIYRHTEILDAIHQLKTEGVGIHCTMVGAGACEEALKEKTASLSLHDQLNWLGRIPNYELPEALMQAQVYIAVPETEGVSASLFEAMACGCFPIVTDLPANRAFIDDGYNGMLVPVGRPEVLAEKIKLFFSNPEKYSAAIQANRLFIEKHSNSQVNMDLFYLTYLSLLKKKNSCVEL